MTESQGQRRNLRRILVYVSIVTLVSLVAAIGGSLMLGQEGLLREKLLATAAASLDDERPSNDINPGISGDLCALAAEDLDPDNGVAEVRNAKVMVVCYEMRFVASLAIVNWIIVVFGLLTIMISTTSLLWPELFVRWENVRLPRSGARALIGAAVLVAVVVLASAGWLGWVRVVDTTAPLPWRYVNTTAVAVGPDNVIRPRLVWLYGGQLGMGSTDGGRSDERPWHEVSISPFAMCETEVSLRQYERVMDERPNDCSAGCKQDHPVQNVSWEDAIRYLNELTDQENNYREIALESPLTRCYDETSWTWDRSCTGYRLPTEAEWEYAARAGTQTAYSFGDDAALGCTYANLGDSDCKDGFEKLAPVQSRLAPNPWGLHGIHGNVWEWVYDAYDIDFYGNGPSEDPVNIGSTTSLRVLRGGSFSTRPPSARSAARFKHQPQFGGRSLGFRCARSF